MPLAFPSLSHGTIAFGFYNIETDSLLLDGQIFFCTDFCEAATAIADRPGMVTLPGHVFTDPAAMGDLMGAIHGARHIGYLGEIYRRWPFPRDPEGFRQKLDGHLRQAETLAVLDRHAERTVIGLERSAQNQVAVGPYVFSLDQFVALVDYVWRGGYPTWEGFGERGECPDHVRALARTWNVDDRTP